MLYLRSSCIYRGWLINQNVFSVTNVWKTDSGSQRFLPWLFKKKKKKRLDGKKQVNITVHRAAFRLYNKHKCSVGTSGVTYCTYCHITFTLHATSNNISAESTVGINTIWDELIVCLYLHRHSLSILLIQQGSKMQTTVHLVSGHDWVTNSSV